MILNPKVTVYHFPFSGIRKEKRRGGRSFYPLRTELPEDTQSNESAILLEQLMATNPFIVPIGEPIEKFLESMKEGKHALLARTSNAITKELHLIVEWAKQVPGFSKLSQRDQILLLTAAGMEIIVLRVIFRSIPYHNKIYLNSTTLLEREICYQALNTEIVDMILDVVDRLKAVGLDKVEYACLMSILLTDPGRCKVLCNIMIS